MEEGLKLRDKHVIWSNDEITRVACWDRLRKWIVPMIQAEEPEEKEKTDVLINNIPGITKLDWNAWKRGIGRFVFITRPSELPHLYWSGLDAFPRDEYFMAVPIVDCLDRPIGLWAKGTQEALLFPNFIRKEHQNGFVLLQPVPRSPVYVAGRVIEIMVNSLNRSNISGKPYPLIPYVWGAASFPDELCHPEIVEPKVLAYLHSLEDMSMVLAKKLPVLLEVNKRRTSIDSLNKLSGQVMGWEETIVSAARQQGGVVRNWAAQIGLAGTENTAPYQFIRKHDERLFEELAQGNLMVSKYGDRTVWARKDGIFSMDRKNVVYMITNCVIKIVAIFLSGGKNKRASCEGTIEDNLVSFEVPIEMLATSEFTERLSIECLKQANCSLYCKHGMEHHIGRISLAMHKPITGKDKKIVWGWHRITGSFRLGKVIIKMNKPASNYTFGRADSPRLSMFQCDPAWLKTCGRQNYQTEYMWAVAALIAATLVNKKRRWKAPANVGIITSNRNTARRLPLAILGLTGPKDGTDFRGWPGFFKSGKDVGPVIKIRSEEQFERSKGKGRRWWSVVPKSMPVPSFEQLTAAARILPGWIQYFAYHAHVVFSDNDSQELKDYLAPAVIKSMSAWFKSLGGDPTVIDRAASMIEIASGPKLKIARSTIVKTLVGLLDNNTVSIKELTGSIISREREEKPTLWKQGDQYVMVKRHFFDLFCWRVHIKTRQRYTRNMVNMKVLQGSTSAGREVVFNKSFMEEVYSSSSSLIQSGLSGSTSSTNLCEGSLGVISGTPSLIGQDLVACQSEQQA